MKAERDARPEVRADLGEDDFYDEDPKHRAAMYRERAARLEEWGGVLHDHPISETFREAYPGVDFAPESLPRLEDEFQDDLDLAENLKAEAYLWDRQHTVDDPRDFRTKVMIKNLLKTADEATIEEHHRLQETMAAALEASNAFTIKLFEEAKIQPLQNKAAVLQNLLDDIRSGRASQ